MLTEAGRPTHEVGTATTAALAAHPGVEVGERQVRAHLETLRERGAVSRERDPADGRRVVWQDDELHRVNEHGVVDLELVAEDELTEEVAELARTTFYTWEFRNPWADMSALAPAPGTGGVEAGSGTEVEKDPPPDPGD